MAKPHSTKLVETDFDEYLDQRISQLGLDTTLQKLRSSAGEFEDAIGWVNIQANVLWVLGASLLIAAGGGVVTGKTPLSALDITTLASAGLIAFALFALGFRRRSWSSYLGRTGFRSLRCSAQDEIDELLDQVDSGSHTVMRLASSGTGTAATPNSHRPVDQVLGKGCLADHWFPSSLFGSANADRQFVVITPEATGDWYNCYLWHPPVSEHLLALFDRTPEIYADEPIKRTKARIALREIAAFVTEQNLSARTNTKKDSVVSAFEKALKIEAARLRAAGEIDDLEERQLCRLNITGEAPSSDPAETSGNRGRKPDSWFRNLMTGHYDPVTRDLAITIRNELNVSPAFVA
ncbi:MAG: hypothetical protein ACKOPE_13995 [Novosphingobium sp.]